MEFIKKMYRLKFVFHSFDFLLNRPQVDPCGSQQIPLPPKTKKTKREIEEWLQEHANVTRALQPTGHDRSRRSHKSAEVASDQTHALERRDDTCYVTLDMCHDCITTAPCYEFSRPTDCYGPRPSNWPLRTCKLQCVINLPLHLVTSSHIYTRLLPSIHHPFSPTSPLSLSPFLIHQTLTLPFHGTGPPMAVDELLRWYPVSAIAMTAHTRRRTRIRSRWSGNVWMKHRGALIMRGRRRRGRGSCAIGSRGRGRGWGRVGVGVGVGPGEDYWEDRWEGGRWGGEEYDIFLSCCYSSYPP